MEFTFRSRNRLSPFKAISGTQGSSSLLGSFTRAMILAVVASLGITMLWTISQSVIAAHFTGTGWSQAALVTLDDALANFISETRLLADLTSERKDRFGSQLGKEDFAVTLTQNGYQQVIGTPSIAGPWLAANQNLKTHNKTSGFLSVGGQLYGMAKSTMTGLPGSRELLLFRKVDQGLLEKATRATTAEMTLLVGTEPVVSSLKDRTGKPLLPKFTPKFLAELHTISMNGFATAREEILVKDYRGFKTSDGNWSDIGADHVKVFYTARKITGLGEEPLGYAVAMIPIWAVLGAIKSSLIGSLIFFVVLCVIAVLYAKKTALKFLQPLEREIQKINEISEKLSPLKITPFQSNSEVEMLQNAVKQMIQAVDHDQDSSNKLEQERARGAFASKMASLGEMSAGIAHEINTPLAVIHAKADQMIELMLETPLDLPTLGQLCGGIVVTTDRIAKIVNSLRSFARDGSLEEPQLVPMGDLVERVLDLCRERFMQHSVKLEIPKISPQVIISCRQTEIMQVLLNLLNNAFDVVKDSTERWVRLDVSHESAEITIRVTDSGHGIDPEVARNIFTPFFTTKGPGKGTGLGLSISRNIAETHGGTLEIDHNSQHTCLVLRLPALGVSNSEANHDNRETVAA